MNTDQTASREQSDLVPYCLQCRLAKNINRQGEQTTIVVTGRKTVNHTIVQKC